jgi:hypothetical protein
MERMAMPLYIKDGAVAALAKELAQRRRCTVTDLVRNALEKERERLQVEDAARDAEVRAIQQRFRHDCPTGSSDHGFLYDKDGLPVQ